MVQRLHGRARSSRSTCLSDLDGRCLNAIPRTMIESRGGESIKGTVIADPELIELGRAVVEALGVRGPVHRAGVPRPRDRPAASPTSTRASAARSLRRCTPRCPGRTYPELIVRMARGERIEPHVGEFLAGRTFTRYFWQIELDGDCSRPAATSWSGPARRRHAEGSDPVEGG